LIASAVPARIDHSRSSPGANERPKGKILSLLPMQPWHQTAASALFPFMFSALGAAGALLASTSCTFPKPFNPPITMSATLPRPTRQRPPPIEFYLFAAVLALRLVSLARLAQSDLLLPGSGDMQFYNSWALRILHGTWTDHLAFYGLPLYPYLLAAIYKVCGYSPFVPGLLQAILDSGTAVLLYKLARSVFAESNSRAAATRPARGEVIGVLAAIGWMFCQPAQAYSIILMPTVCFVFVSWFIVWRIVTLKQAPRLWLVFSLGLLTGFTAMGVATILVLVPLLLVAIFVRWSASKSRRLTSAALIIAGVFVGTSPAWIHNYFVARDPVFLSAHGGINFWIGNNPEATGYPRFPPGLHSDQQALLEDSIRVAEQTTGDALRRSEVSSYWSSQAGKWIASHPFRWLELLGRKIENFWNAFQYDDLSIITELREEAIIFPGIGFGAIAAVALPGMLIACWRLRESRWIVAAVLLQMVSLLPVFVTERYRLVALPGLLIFAGFGVWELWQQIAAGRYTKATQFVALLLVSTALVCLPQRDSSLWALDVYNSGLKALDAGRFTQAKQKLDLAYSYFPRNAGVNFAEGNLQLAMGDRVRAKIFYQSTLRLDPRNSGAWNNLGVLALQEKRWDLAAELFARALELNENGKTFYLLAEAQFGAGNLLAADSAIIRALELNPAQSEFRLLADRIAVASNMPPLP
jgi:tetratricopeptide (TPR) repeat protein